MEMRYPEPELVADALRLRAWNDDDLECVRHASHDPRILDGSTVPSPFTTQEGLAFIARQRSRADNGEGLSFAIANAATGAAAGLLWLGVRPQPGVLGIGYWLIGAARGRGLASCAVRLATEWALEHDDIARVEAWVAPTNIASQRLLEATGYVREGVLRAFLTTSAGRTDAVVFSRVQADR